MADEPNRGTEFSPDLEMDHPLIQSVHPRIPTSFIATHNRNIPGSNRIIGNSRNIIGNNRNIISNPRPIVSSQRTVPSSQAQRAIISIQPVTHTQQADPIFSVRGLPTRSQDCIPERTPYDDYKYEKKRLDTFTTWPKNANVRKEDLARNGFIYLQSNDRVQCVFCRGILSSWDPDDIVAEEHRKHCPECPFAFGLETKNVPLCLDRQVMDARPVPNTSPFSNLAKPIYNTTVNIPVSEATCVTSCLPGAGGDIGPDTRLYGQTDLRSLPSLPLGPTSVMPGVPAESTVSPRYRAWSDLDTRIRSFKGWPSQMNQKPQDLAEAGLIYLGSGDRCKCFWCGGELYEWEPEDDPWEEHAKWFPHCNFVQNIKGENYVQYIKDRQNGLSVTPPDVGNPHVLSVLQEGYTQDEIEEVFKIYGATCFLDARAIVEAILKKRQERTAFRNRHNAWKQDLVLEDMETEQDEKPPTQAVQAVSDQEVSNRRSQVQTSDASSLGKSTSSPALGTSANKDVDIVLLENEKLKDQTLCKICLDNELSITFFPCGHLSTCEECSRTMNLCPICRKPIENKYKIFWS